MRTKIATAALIGGLGLTGGLLIGPSLATAADSTTSTTGSGRIAAIKDALKGLVSDKTLTQAQAEKVATTLDTALPHRGDGMRDGRRGGRHGGGALGPDVVAKVLGLTAAELRTQLDAGKTLTQIAAAKGISKATLIDNLVKAGQDTLAQAVTNGRLTQAQADVLTSTLRDRITSKVDRAGHGPRVRRHADRSSTTSSTA